MISSISTALSKILRGARDLFTRHFLRATQQAEALLPAKRILWHRGQIATCSAELEKQFLKLSTGIEMLSGKSDELVVRSRELLKRALGQDDDGSTFQAAVDLVQRPLGFNNECLQTIGELASSLETMSGRISKLHRFQYRLDQSIAPLKFLQTMFRIESATSSPETQALFTSISLEIERLQVRMSTMVSKEFEAIENTQSTLNGVMLRFREIHSQQVAVATRRDELQTTLVHLQQQVEENQGRDVRLIGVIQTIAAKVAEMVTALQYQDILSQRLAHVSEALRGMADQMQAPESARSSDLLSFLRDSSRVESAQLEDIEKVLNRAVETIDGALAAISHEIGGLSTECILLKDIESATVTGDGTVQILLDAITETRGFSEFTYSQTDDICHLLEPIAGLVGGLTESILEVSIQIRLIALNAQIQAIKAGTGTGLEVLSARTCSISEEITDIVSDISVELTALKDGLKSGLETIELTRARNLEFTELLKTGGGEQELRLHDFRNQAFAEMNAVQELITDVQEKSRTLCNPSDLRTLVFDATGPARIDLQRFSDQLPAGRLAGTPNTLVEERASIYTAASERAAHERALRGEQAASPPGTSEQELVEGSVEFF